MNMIHRNRRARLQEGFDPAKVRGDILLLRDGVARTFVPFTPRLNEAICSRELRL